MAMMKKPKKPAFDASSLPKSKGITARPAKMRDASPNFVNKRKIVVTSKKGEPFKQSEVKDAGTNPGNSNVPTIKYNLFGNVKKGLRANYEEMDNKGNMRNINRACGYEGCDVPGGKKGTKAAPKKPMAKAVSKKTVSAKKPMMKSTKK